MVYAACFWRGDIFIFCVIKRRKMDKKKLGRPRKEESVKAGGVYVILSPEDNATFQKQLADTGRTQAEHIRRLIRGYGKPAK